MGALASRGVEGSDGPTSLRYDVRHRAGRPRRLPCMHAISVPVAASNQKATTATEAATARDIHIIRTTCSPQSNYRCRHCHRNHRCCHDLLYYHRKPSSRSPSLSSKSCSLARCFLVVLATRSIRITNISTITSFMLTARASVTVVMIQVVITVGGTQVLVSLSGPSQVGPFCLHSNH